MQKRGFTLIELIVVVAIIGVLAAILVPAMMGYITRAKIMTANSAAKSISNAITSSMTEITAYDLPPKVLTEDTVTVSGADIAAQMDLDVPSTIVQIEAATGDTRKTLLLNFLYCRISSYFNDIDKIDEVSFKIRGNTTCEGVGLMKGRCPGTAPIAIDQDTYSAFKGTWDSDTALKYALGELS